MNLVLEQILQKYKSFKSVSMLVAGRVVIWIQWLGQAEIFWGTSQRLDPLWTPQSLLSGGR